MTIKRKLEGWPEMEFELTPQEIQEAYRELEIEYNKEDVETQLESLVESGDITKKQADAIRKQYFGEIFNEYEDALSNLDTGWSNIIDNSIKEYAKCVKEEENA